MKIGISIFINKLPPEKLVLAPGAIIWGNTVLQYLFPVGNLNRFPLSEKSWPKVFVYIAPLCMWVWFVFVFIYHALEEKYLHYPVDNVLDLCTRPVKPICHDLLF